MRADIFFILGVIVFIFIAWSSTGGPDRPISWSGPFITPVKTAGDEQVGYGSFFNLKQNWRTTPSYNDADGSKSSYDSTQGAENTSRELWSLGSLLADLQKDTREAKLYGEASPYSGKVRISGSTSGLKSTDADTEYLTISLSSGSEAVTITGWKIVSVRTNAYGYIPQGTAVMKSGRINETAPITLQPGERAIISSGRSPVGVSFRENACSGYLSEYQNFTPKMQTSCPRAIDDYERFYTGNEKSELTCKSLIEDVSRCEIPETSGNLPSACFAFIDTYLNYNGCVATHANDRNFWGKTWRVYLGHYERNKNERQDLWRSDTDTLKLLDAEGKTVDVLTY